MPSILTSLTTPPAGDGAKRRPTLGRMKVTEQRAGASAWGRVVKAKSKEGVVEIFVGKLEQNGAEKCGIVVGRSGDSYLFFLHITSPMKATNGGPPIRKIAPDKTTGSVACGTFGPKGGLSFFPSVSSVGARIRTRVKMENEGMYGRRITMRPLHS
jgi:hypothetical protein